MERQRWMLSIGVAGAVFAAFMLGGWLFAPEVEEPPKPEAAAQAPPAGHDHGAPAPDEGEDKGEGEAEVVWTCSMDPQVRLKEPGKCPICGMDLISVTPTAGPPRVTLSEEARALARLRTTKVARRDANVELALVGKVTYDETAVARITARFGGRIERMYVDYTGTAVRKGDHLFQLYSPELLVAEEELIQAQRAVDRLPATASPGLRSSLEATLRAAREKLKLWQLQPWQIRRIAKSQKKTTRVTIYAPIGGIVTQKAQVEGSYVKTGEPIYTITDLSRVWVMLQAYESDVQWLKWGQRVEFQVAAYPGKRFRGKIAFVSPAMDPKTRTVEVRLTVDNPERLLKPGMFVRSTVKVPVASGGVGDVSRLAGKWVSPMHPEVVSDRPGPCSVCGMDLVPAEEHWLVGPALREGGQRTGELPLVIPATAPLLTGKRAVVFVEIQGAEEPTYQLREVVLGPRVDDGYVVEEGLMAGELVVSHGAFKLDSALQLRGDPSAMAYDPAQDQAKGEGADEAPDEGPIAKAGRALADAHAALEERDWDELRAAAERLAKASQGKLDVHLLRGPAAWLASAESEDARRVALGQLLFLARQVRDMPFVAGIHAHEVTTPRGFDAALDKAAAAAGQLSKALAADDLAASKTAAAGFAKAVAALAKAKHPLDPALLDGAAKAAEAGDIKTLRQHYGRASRALVPLAAVHREAITTKLQRSYCPMAFGDTGEYWLEPPGELANPYFGAEMLRCGVVEAKYE